MPCPNHSLCLLAVILRRQVPSPAVEHTSKRNFAMSLLRRVEE